MQFLEFLDEYGIPRRTEGEHARSGWIQLDCPWCGAGTEKYHLGYNIAKQFFHCWKCGWHSVIDTLLEIVPSLSRDDLRALYRPSETPLAAPKPKGKYREPRGVEPLGAAHRRYLQGRRFQPDEIATIWDVQGIGLRGRPPWRLFIPIIVEGHCVAWTSRALHDEGTRYRSSSLEDSDIPVKELLYGADYCANEVLVVEGPTDAWRIGPGAVATLGTAVSMKQCELLSSFSVVHICFDSSPEAQRRANKLYSELDGLVYVDIVRCPAEDPGSMTRQQTQKLRRQYLSQTIVGASL